jgi:hypothetical protein
MFEKSLSEKLKKIFDFKKVTFSTPSDSQEQETLFINVERANSYIKEGRQISRVNGKLTVFANSDKLPYGYFSKCLEKASALDTKDLYFFDLEENAGTYQNISERSMGFMFLYNSQYDPEIGSITSLEVNDE